MTKTFELSSTWRVLPTAGLLLALAASACSADNTDGSPSAGSAGTPSAGTHAGTSSTAGTTSSGGAGGAPVSQGGSAQAGQQSQAGSGGGGGKPSAGAGGMSGGAGGVAVGGGGSGTGGAAPGGKPPIVPSEGCGKANPQAGSSGSPLTVSGHQYYVKLPTGYDASKPYPAMMMFNPTGNPLSWAEQNAGFEAAGPKEAWIRVYPTMANNANGWGSGDVSFFQPFYDQVLSSFCIDKSRVFAAGESSGGDFVSILGCEYGDKIAVTAPCATKPVTGYGLDVPIKRQCKGEVTAIVIHGKNDNQVGPENGPKTRDFYAALNHCDATMSTPVMGYTTPQSNCVQFQGCDPGYPVFWCQHTDPNYNNTNHGWPAFAPKFLWEYLSVF